MREVFIILVVVAVLAVLTAIQYRRQIVALIGFYKTFKTMRDALRHGAQQPAIRDSPQGIELVRCSRCGKWISPSTTINVSGNSICASECVRIN